MGSFAAMEWVVQLALSWRVTIRRPFPRPLGSRYLSWGIGKASMAKDQRPRACSEQTAQAPLDAQNLGMAYSTLCCGQCTVGMVIYLWLYIAANHRLPRESGDGFLVFEA